MKSFSLATIAFLLLILAMTFGSCMCGDDDDSSSSGDDDDDNDDVWVDPDSGLMWQSMDAGYFQFEAALDYCENLDLGGYTDWRMPTISELRSLIRGCPDTEIDGDCGVTDSCLDWTCYNEPCYGCTISEGPGPEGRYWPADLPGEGAWTWSSSVGEGHSWRVNFPDANVHKGTQTMDGNHVRCVR